MARKGWPKVATTSEVQCNYHSIIYLEHWSMTTEESFYLRLVLQVEDIGLPGMFRFSYLIVCFTSYFVFSIAVLPHSPGVVYYHLLLRRETIIPGVAPFSFQIGIWDLLCA